jgi:hypothetical protein
VIAHPLGKPLTLEEPYFVGIAPGGGRPLDVLAVDHVANEQNVLLAIVRLAALLPEMCSE